MEDEYTTFKQQPAMPGREEGGAPESLPDQASGFEPNPAMNSVTGEKAAARRGACHAVIRTLSAHQYDTACIVYVLGP
jgi:hypothetical protein